MANDKRTKRSRTPAARTSKLTPQQVAVIAGLLTNSLTVDSVLIDKDQRLQIVLGGSLRRATRLDQLIDELSNMNVADVLESVLKR